MTKRLNGAAWAVMTTCLLMLSFGNLLAQPGGGMSSGNMHRWVWGGQLPVTTMKGSIILDSAAQHGGKHVPTARLTYYLDTTTIGQRTVMLFFGPPGYHPNSGTVRPQSGDMVTVRGGLDTTSTPPTLSVFWINGQEWRDSTGAPPWGGKWIHRTDMDTSRVPVEEDTVSWAAFPPNAFGNGMMGNGMMWPDSLFALFSELPFDSAASSFGHMVSLFHLEFFDPSGNSLMHSNRMGDSSGHGALAFNHPIRIQLHVDSDSLSSWNASFSQLVIRYLDADSIWQEFQGAEFDSTSNIITISDTLVSSFYIVSSPSVLSVETANNSIPASYSVAQNYPNPFNPSTTIEFAVPKASHVTLEVFDQLGRRVATLVSGDLPAGSYRTRWDARGFASGVYFYRFTGAGFTQTRSLLLLK